ncbi:MAG: hypothetical protein FJ293_09430 [Planctomycetes bacterium]|nr:hypothetical protein [Planctomycetota bacterium]
MIRASILGVALLGGLATAALPAAGTLPFEKEELQTLFGTSNQEKLGKMVRTYYAHIEKEELQKANKELQKLIEEAGKVAKTAKIADPLLAIEDWREIIRRGLMVEKPTAAIVGRGDLKVAEMESPIDTRANEKELTGIFNNKLKAYISLPNDFAKVAYPVILALHTTIDEVKSAKDLTKAKAIDAEVKAWATATFSKELLTKAIVICPVMDIALRGSDNVSWSRPRWDSDHGALWAFRALSEFIFKNVNHDPSRIYVDGTGEAAAAAMLFCARFPGVLTGAIVRGAPPQRIDFEKNCRGTPVLFVGDAGKSFHDEWAGKEGLVLAHHPTIDDATLIQWLTDHPKEYSPTKVGIETSDFVYAAGSWFRVTDQDATRETMRFLIDAAIDREANEVTVVTSEKVSGFEIFLNDRMLDLSKPVKVIHRYVVEIDEATASDEAKAAASEKMKDVVRFNGPVKRILEDTLQWAYLRPYSNTGEIYVASIRVDLGG